MSKAKSARTRTASRTERQVMAVLCDAGTWNWTNEQRIEAAGVSRSTFYKILRDPWFVQYQRDTVLEIVRSSVGAITDAAISCAVTEVGRDGHQDRKMLLQMAGLHADKQEVSGAGGGPIEYLDRQRAADEELAEWEAAKAAGAAEHDG